MSNPLLLYKYATQNGWLKRNYGRGKRSPVSMTPLSVSRYESVATMALTLSVWSAAPVAGSYSLMVRSSDLDASCLPSGEKATALM